jgi:hypothetical protein
VRLAWGVDDARELASVEDLDRALEELELHAVHDPELVVLVRDDGASLSLGLGRPVTVLDYVPGNRGPPYFRSVSSQPARESLWLRFAGEPSEYPPDAAVPIAVGRRAFRHFLCTGELSRELSWAEN